MNARPPLPHGLDRHAAPTMKVTFTLTLPDKHEVVAIVQAFRSSDTVPIEWHGNLGRLDAPPGSSDTNMLAAYLDAEAARTKGKLKTEYDGAWVKMDGDKA